MRWSEKYFSKSLNMLYKVDKDTGRVMTEDRVYYELEEIKGLEEIDLAVHLVKKVFNGKISLDK